MMINFDEVKVFRNDFESGFILTDEQDMDMSYDESTWVGHL